jgi:hypothetical protein
MKTAMSGIGTVREKLFMPARRFSVCRWAGRWKLQNSLVLVNPAPVT